MGTLSGLGLCILGGLTDLIGEWLEEKRLNSPNIVPSSTPLGSLTRNAAEIEIVLVEASEQQPAIEVDEDTAAPNPHFAFKDHASKLSSRVTDV